MLCFDFASAHWAQLAGLAVSLYHAYEQAALASPLLTKASTSGVAYLLGDFLAQSVSGSQVSLMRMVRSTIAGFVSHGPQLHFWCLLLDR